jgi:2-polyprenyl-3-methyl-5-hydroxy-6-metoxy-1,4-benzoquinol methylase
MRKNTPQLWDELWEKSLSTEEDQYALAKEAHSIRWQRIEKATLELFGSFEGLKVIELGAGSGTYAALMAKRGAHVTILDYSNGALERGREFFQRNGLQAAFTNQDALALPSELLNHFDVSLSFGLAEHFRGPDRQKIVEAHLHVLRPGGLTFISVPNQFCPPYRIFKFIAQHTGKWIFGEEYPYSRWELITLAKRLGVRKYKILGGSLPGSFDFINPFKALAIVRNWLRIKDNLDINALRQEKGTLLDSVFSYALVLCANKPL